MLKTISKFSGYLRAAGVPVSPGEEMDCLMSLEGADLAPAAFYQALRCTLVKRQRDLSIFDRVYNLYFKVLIPWRGEDRECCFDEETGTMLSSITPGTAGNSQGVPGLGSPAQLLLEALLSGHRAAMEHLARVGLQCLGELGQGHLEHMDETARQVQVAMEWFMAEYEIGKMVASGQLQGEQAEACRSSLDYVEDYIGRILEEELWRSLGETALPHLLRNLDPAKKDFSRLQVKQLTEMRKHITRLGRQLATGKSRRYRQGVRGKLDLRRTLRRAAATGGFPIKPAYRRREIDRPEMVLLCDVSGSVARFSEFMLQLVYTAQQRFRRLRSFIFVDRLAEVSELFGRLSIEEAVEIAYRKGGFSNSGLSDFGSVFRIFEQRHLPLLTRKTSLVILGDARNNWRPPRVESLAEMSRHVGKTFWLNPRPEDMWYGEDSILAQYQPYCHKVFECRNLEQLARVSRMIL